MIRNIILGVFAASLLSISGLQAQDQIRLADTQLELKAYKKALETYMTCDLTSNEVMAKIAQCYVALNDDDRAVEWFSKIDASYYNTIAADYGQALKRVGKYEEAKSIFAYDLENGEFFIQSCDYAIDLMQGKRIDVYPAAFNTSHSDFALSFLGDKPVFCSFAENLSFINPIYEGEGNRLYSAESSETLTERRVYNLRSAIKDNYAIGPVFYAGNLVAYVKNSAKDGRRMIAEDDRECNIYFASKGLGGDFEQEYAFDFNNAAYSNTHPWLSEDGSTMIYASNMDGGYGGFDLYSTTLENGKWTPPVNLGAVINTPGNEISPFFHEGDLYFASDFHAGLGGFDIFLSRQQEGQYTLVSNMGNGINSPSDDYFPIKKWNRIYFTSNRVGGRGADDIYVSEYIDQEPTPPAAFVLGERKEAIAASPNVALVSDKEVIERKVVASNYHIPLNYTGVSAFEIESAEPVRPAIADLNLLDRRSSNVFKETRKLQVPDLCNTSFETLDTEKIDVLLEEDELPANVYFVQLAAFSKRSANLSDFERLVEYGNIYKVNLSSAIKIRLGYFTDEEEARNILRKVKAEGYKDAFLTYQPLDISNLELVFSNYDDKSYPSSRKEDRFAENSNATSTNENLNDYEPSSYMSKPTYTGNINYKVRLASYTDPSYFDIKSAKGLGHIEQWTKGGWTIFILSGYSDLNAAEIARRKAVNKGFKDAEIVLDNDGILERVKSN